MTKKDITEIKKQFHPEKGVLTTVALCLADGDFEFRKRVAFSMLSDELQEQYQNLAKKVLSGSLGKSLFVLPVTDESETSVHATMQTLRERYLEEEPFSKLCEQIREASTMDGPYLILMVHGLYDIPGTAAENGESLDVYQYVVCAVCPVKQKAAGLVYDKEGPDVNVKLADWQVEAPVTGFLFPAYSDRQTDIHNLLYYSKNANLPYRFLAEDIWGAALPMGEEEQKDCWKQMLSEAFGESVPLRTMQEMEELLAEKMTETEDGAHTVTTVELKALLEEVSGADLSTVHTEPVSLTLAGIQNPKSVIKTDTATIQVKPEWADQVEVRQVDGRNCLIIPMEGETLLNDIPIH